LTRPSSVIASAIARESFRAQTRALDGRLKGGHDEII